MIDFSKSSLSFLSSFLMRFKSLSFSSFSRPERKSLITRLISSLLSLFLFCSKKRLISLIKLFNSLIFFSTALNSWFNSLSLLLERLSLRVEISCSILVFCWSSSSCLLFNQLTSYCQEPDLNWWHEDFQSSALPTELSRHDFTL